MGKIVKYCAVCEESFAEKFAFCPNCGQPMTAFEMNPIVKEAPVAETVAAPTKIVEEPTAQAPAPDTFEAAPEVETPQVSETDAFSAEQTQAFSAEPVEEDNQLIEEDIQEIQVEESPAETKTYAAAASATSTFNNFQTTNYKFQPDSQAQEDDGFHVTVIEEKNVKERNLLFLGSMALMLTLALGGTVYSLFSKELGVGAIDDAGLFAAVVVEDVPVEIEEQPKPKNNDNGGGGGGGGKEEPEPASKGRLVSQSEKPITPPSVNIPQLKNPSLPVIMETQGNIKRPITAERPGLPGSDNLNPSNGTGRGGGIGGGNGTGIGGGNGTGEGYGNGSGSGNGNGSGNGDGRGPGTGGTPPPPPQPKPVEVVSEPFRIISKPRATYTDAARQNQVTGVVRLRVTFSASGSIGSIAPVSGLPYGLTEQAIAAARQIRFEPAKKNGVPVASTKIIEYSFTIY